MYSCAYMYCILDYIGSECVSEHVCVSACTVFYSRVGSDFVFYLFMYVCVRTPGDSNFYVSILYIVHCFPAMSVAVEFTL